ncbi:MAG: type II secretion system minor pseudopilin GspK [Magnetococcales bacterium]|nr:type II secretion system minor pseudopilin GspK [Magnetococcales bacterium]
MWLSGERSGGFFKCRPPHDHGAALITALLVVATASITWAGLLSQQNLAIRESAGYFDRDQAYQFILGGEAWAREVLHTDRKDNKYDSLNEDWAHTLDPQPIEGGMISGHLEDMQGRINLNGLVINEGMAPLIAGRLERLLVNLDLDSSLVDAIADWIDADHDPQGSGGAEEGSYLALEPAYRPANRRLTTVSEIRLIQGMTALVYERLTPFVSVLPFPTDININTAPPEVLMSLADGFSKAMAMTLVDIRKHNAFVDVSAFVNHASIKDFEIEPAGLTVTSDYFLAKIKAQIGRGRVSLFSLLERTGKGVRVIQRGRGAL